MRNIILSPHYDDAVFSCFNKLNDPKTLVINLFTGIPNKNKYTLWDLICGQPNSNKMMLKRKKENALVLNKLECYYLDLDFLDNQYEKNIDTNLILKTLLSKLKKGDVIYAPMAESKIYKHPDHLITNQIARKLSKLGYEVYFYADLPYMKIHHYIANVKLDKLETRTKLKYARQYKSQYKATNITSLGLLNRSIKSGLERIEKIRK